MSMKPTPKETQHFTGALVVAQAHRSQGALLSNSVPLAAAMENICSCYFKMFLSSFVSFYRIVWLLLKNGARVFQGNKLGLTPVHSAAAKGNYKALQVGLLLLPFECLILLL